MEDFKQGGNQVVELACSNRHVFHMTCIKAWVDKNDICPMCREQIIPE